MNVLAAAQRPSAPPARLCCDAASRRAHVSRCSRARAQPPRATASQRAEASAWTAPPRPAPAAPAPSAPQPAPAWRGAALAVLASLALAAPPPAALAAAFGGVIELSDISYVVEDCPKGFYLPEKGRCKCLHVTATANNGLKSAVEAASVFGFINDVNGDSAAAVNANGNSRTVLAPILTPVPLGRSTVEFEVAVFESALDAGPLKLKGFKATPSLAAVEERFKSFGACELDPTAEGCDGAV